MNGIVRVTNKPAKLIDVLRSERQRRRSAFRTHSSHVSFLRWTLWPAVAAAEVMVLTPSIRCSSARFKRP